VTRLLSIVISSLFCLVAQNTSADDTKTRIYLGVSRFGGDGGQPVDGYFINGRYFDTKLFEKMAYEDGPDPKKNSVAKRYVSLSPLQAVQSNGDKTQVYVTSVRRPGYGDPYFSIKVQPKANGSGNKSLTLFWTSSSPIKFVGLDTVSLENVLQKKLAVKAKKRIATELLLRDGQEARNSSDPQAIHKLHELPIDAFRVLKIDVRSPRINKQILWATVVIKIRNLPRYSRYSNNSLHVAQLIYAKDSGKFIKDTGFLDVDENSDKGNYIFFTVGKENNLYSFNMWQCEDGLDSTIIDYQNRRIHDGACY